MRLRLPTRAGLLLLAALVTGCAAEAPPAATEAKISTKSGGCGAEPPLAPGASATFTLPVGELEREWVLHLPPGYDSRRPAPLVLDFHGYTGTAPTEEEYTGLSELADRESFLVVYPQSTGFTAEDGQLITSWNDLAGNASPGPAGPTCTEGAFPYPGPPECGDPTPCNWASCHDDVGFIAALLDRLESELCVDLDRVYATGMSNGGMFVHRLGCDMPERFAAIAPVSGTLARGFNCAPEVPLAMMNIYGSQDDYVSQLGGVSSDGFYYDAATDVLAKWAGPASQRCATVTTPYETSRDGTLNLACIQHADCTTGAEVVHCTWDGAHDWPRAEGQPFGNEIIWDFFSRHSRTASRSAGSS